MTTSSPGPLETSVSPFSANKLPTLPDSAPINDALRAVVIACNGSIYHGSEIEAQIRAVKFLRTRPDIAAALGLATPVAAAA